MVVSHFYHPRSMLPAHGSRRIPQETAFFPANSSRFRLISRRNRPEIHTEHGSSIPAGKFRTRNRPLPRISTHRKYAGTRPFPTGKSWEHDRIPQEREGKHPHPGLYQDFHRFSILKSPTTKIIFAFPMIMHLQNKHCKDSTKIPDDYQSSDPVSEVFDSDFT